MSVVPFQAKPELPKSTDDGAGVILVKSTPNTQGDIPICVPPDGVFRHPEGRRRRRHSEGADVQAARATGGGRRAIPDGAPRVSERERAP